MSLVEGGLGERNWTPEENGFASRVRVTRMCARVSYARVAYIDKSEVA